MYTKKVPHLKSTGFFFLKSSRGDFEPVRIDAIRPNGKAGSGLFFVLFSGISSRSQAEELQNLVLYSQTEPEPDPDSPDEDDDFQVLLSCEGYHLEDPENNISGYITAVLENPAHPIFEIQLESELLLVPVVEAYIAEIDHENQLVVAQNLDAFFGTGND